MLYNITSLHRGACTCVREARCLVFVLSLAQLIIYYVDLYFLSLWSILRSGGRIASVLTFVGKYTDFRQQLKF